MSNFKFFEDNKASVQPVEQTYTEISDSQGNSITESARYRVEQLTVSKMNGVVQSHAETKRQFFVTRKKEQSNWMVTVEMEDNIVRVYPESLQETINLLIDLDNVKSKTHVVVNPLTGKIDHILNHHEIITNWKEYRMAMEDKYSTFNSAEAKLNVLKFLTVAENIITIENNLIDDLNTKMFYDLFFDQYLVKDRIDKEDVKRSFYSQLFEGESSMLNSTKKITNETQDQVQYLCESVLINPDAERFSKLYDEKYKPLIHYKFSQYDAKIDEHILLNKTGKWIEQADVSIVEEVKNNIEIIVDYKLRKIE
jgi:hypothetical protein